MGTDRSSSTEGKRAVEPLKSARSRIRVQVSSLLQRGNSTSQLLWGIGDLGENGSWNDDFADEAASRPSTLRRTKIC